MINFENINRPNWKYTLLYNYVSPIFRHIYYKKYYALNTERIPKNDPVIAICNHQNGLTDALGILFAFRKDGRNPVFIARADIFKKNIAAKLLRFLRIMPAFRARDVGQQNLGENQAIFNKSASILLEKGVVCLFPEAGHEDCHHLGTFKKGFARIAFKAAEISDFKEVIKIVPFAHHYSSYFGLQRNLMIQTGEAFDFTDLYDLYKEQPKRAEKLLTDRARIIVEEMMLDIKDKSLYDEYNILREIYCEDYLKKHQLKSSYFPNHLTADKAVVAAIDDLREKDSEKFAQLMKQAYTYNRNLEKINLRDWIFRKKLSVGGFWLRTLLAIVLIPFIVVCFLINLIPYNASTLVTRRIKDPMLHSSFHFVIGSLVAYPIWFLVGFITIWCTTGIWWLALSFLVILPLSLIIYLRSKILWKKLYNRIRRFRLWFKGNPVFKESVELRKAIVSTLNKIVD
ncbi:MAG: hypothetical protein EOM76_02670 [Sphingobacteriia bacterium]|jgi:1-acyl-sn-glycerol-3-phosphate acyltransferase|nr:1-acyl-sn-glycerol-3-phosphate acyltransferase [Paludibacteraceae bacterium]NCA79081.1 hypothetical protein [Sphingobacteriia bacterium]